MRMGLLLFKIPDGRFGFVFLVQSFLSSQAAGDFAPAGATRAVCPGPDKGLFRKGPLTPNLFNTGEVILISGLCSPLYFFAYSEFTH